MSSRSRLWASRRRSVSPRVPTVEYARSERSWAKSSQAARNSRLSSARASGSRRCHAGSSLKKVNLAKVRSGTAAMVVLALALLAAPDAAAKHAAHITVAVVPDRTSVEELARVPGMGVGILSAGIGAVSAAQTYLDIGQGARIQDSLYDRPLPRLELEAADVAAASLVAPAAWRDVRERADSAPADIVPGLLGSTLDDAGASVRMVWGAGTAAAMLVDERGSLLASP